jgi:hypothetical protein
MPEIRRCDAGRPERSRARHPNTEWGRKDRIGITDELNRGGPVGRPAGNRKDGP